jgi:hypothetical protein
VEIKGVQNLMVMDNNIAKVEELVKNCKGLL